MTDIKYPPGTFVRRTGGTRKVPQWDPVTRKHFNGLHSCGERGFVEVQQGDMLVVETNHSDGDAIHYWHLRHLKSGRHVGWADNNFEVVGSPDGNTA